MRNCKKNTRHLWYSNFQENEPILDENGDKTGEYSSGYMNPVKFDASLSDSKGKAYADIFGTSLDYTRTASTVEMLPITEESLVWYQTDPVMKADGTVDENTADYTVAGIADGLNGIVIALKARKKNAKVYSESVG